VKLYANRNEFTVSDVTDNTWLPNIH